MQFDELIERVPAVVVVVVVLIAVVLFGAGSFGGFIEVEGESLDDVLDVFNAYIQHTFICSVPGDQKSF